MVSQDAIARAVARAAKEAGQKTSLTVERGELSRGEKRVTARGLITTTGRFVGSGTKEFKQIKEAETKAREMQERAQKIRLEQEKKRAAIEVAKAKLDAQRRAEFKRILDRRALIIAKGSKEKVQTSKDVKTGDKLKITTWTEGSNRVRRVENTTQGTVKYTSFGVKNGGIRQTGGVVVAATPTSKVIPITAAAQVKVVASEVVGKKLVLLKSGKRFRISDSGRIVVGAGVAGNKLEFQDGKLVKVNNQFVGVREIFEPVLTVEKIEQPTGIIARNVKKLNDLRKVKVTSSIRNQQRELKNELAVLGVVAATVVIGGVQGVVALGSGILKLIRDPRKITKVPKKILEGGSALITATGGIGQMIRVSPTEAIAVIGGEYILLRGTGTALRIAGKLPGSAKALVRPALNKADKTRFTVSGNTIKLAGGTASTAESLAKQAARAGRRSVPVTALSDDIFGLIKRKEIVRKPIPGENLLSIKTKRLLKKFDAGKASKTEMIKLDRLIQIETRGAGSLLERATFADPAGRVRVSRLGLETQKDASLLDILSGDFTFRTNKPQIFVFDKIVVEAFPANLKIIARKFKNGKPLTPKETAALLRFQLKKSGKWKPIGAVSRESEIVLAPGELIKKVKTVGHVNIGGKRIPVVKVIVVKASGNLKTLMNKFEMNEISAVELRRLQKLLNSKTGFKNRIYRSGNSRPVARFPGLIGRRGRGRISRVPRRTPTKRIVKRPSKRTPTRKTIPRKTPTRKTPPRRVPARKPTKRPPARPPKRPPRRAPLRPPVKPPVPIPFNIPKGFKKRNLTKKAPVYFVVLKRRGKLVKLNARPLVLKDARDYLAYRLDRGLGRSAWFEPLGTSKSVLGLPKSMKGYFTRVKHKLRPFKIRRGVKKAIRHGYIEKKKFVGDTRSEIVALRRTRAKAAVKRKKNVTTSKVIKTKAIKLKASRKKTKRVIKKRVVKKRSTKRVSKKVKSKKKIIKRVVKRRTVKRKSPTRKKRVVKRKSMRKRKVAKKKKK